MKVESKKSLLKLYNTILEDDNKDDPQAKLMKSIESIGNSDNFIGDLNYEPYNDIGWKNIDGDNTQTKQLSRTEKIENSDSSFCDRNLEISSILNDDKTNNDIILEDLKRENIQSNLTRRTQSKDYYGNTNVDRSHNNLHLDDFNETNIQDLTRSIENMKLSNNLNSLSNVDKNNATKIYHTVEEARDLNK